MDNRRATNPNDNSDKRRTAEEQRAAWARSVPSDLRDNVYKGPLPPTPDYARQSSTYGQAGYTAPQQSRQAPEPFSAVPVDVSTPYAPPPPQPARPQGPTPATGSEPTGVAQFLRTSEQIAHNRENQNREGRLRGYMGLSVDTGNKPKPKGPQR